MKIDGLKALPFCRVVLDEYFEVPTFVDVKIIPPMGRAQIREVVMQSFNLGDLDTKGKTSSIQTKTEGMADREMRTRDLKLKFSFANTNIKVDGQPAVWGKELWDELDDVNPMILEKVVKEIDRTSKLNAGEGDDNPT
jgi:hypothetical protein